MWIGATDLLAGFHFEAGKSMTLSELKVEIP